MQLNRRTFLQSATLGAGAWAAGVAHPFPGARAAEPGPLTAADLPVGSAPRPLDLPHFPSRLHAFVWRNWSLVPVERLAQVVGAEPSDLLRLGRSMGLPAPSTLSRDHQRRVALTLIRRNWHLLPYEQLIQLLGWTPEQLAFALREDDFLFVKLGNLKPRCEPLRYQPSDARTREREQDIARMVKAQFPTGLDSIRDPLFGFLQQLNAPIPPATDSPAKPASRFSPRFCFSYFALYGDPLLEPELDPYPDGYLARLAASGVDGVWLQAVLYRLAPFPWDGSLSARHAERLANLRTLARRIHNHGLGLYLYLNEPRALPAPFFAQHPELRGVVEGDYAALCTSHREVQDYLRDSVTTVCRAVPELAGLFTISASENLTHCWSHGGGAGCPRCRQRQPADVIAEANRLVHAGLRQAGSSTRLLVWDWGWADAWAPGIIEQLPTDVALMSVSEWSLPLKRGGVETVVGEYSISAIGPGPRAQRHWELARRRGLKTIAKIQAGNTWELSAVPYIPAVANVARHVANLREARVDGLMLGWTLGGYPSPNLEIVAELGRVPDSGLPLTPEAAMQQVAQRRFGPALAPAVVQAWQAFSAAFSEFPYHGGLVYNAPLQLGPANLLRGEPSGYRATMVGFPYDDLDAWRQVYPAAVFAAQFEKIAAGFEPGLAGLREALARMEATLTPDRRQAMAGELSVAEAAAIHFRSTANQARFVMARSRLAAARTAAEAQSALPELERVLNDEMTLARRLRALQTADSRIGFEASNQYYYVPEDLVEKVINCSYLLEIWLPEQKQKWGIHPSRPS